MSLLLILRHTAMHIEIMGRKTAKLTDVPFDWGYPAPLMITILTNDYSLSSAPNNLVFTKNDSKERSSSSSSTVVGDAK